MHRERLTGPLRRPLFRRIAMTYAVNELGDWMGIVALSILVFDRTGSALATAGLFLGLRFLPALIAPILVVRFERPPPRFALPVIYCGESAAFAGLALLVSHFSLAGVIILGTIDGSLALTGRTLTRAVVAALLAHHDELRAGNAVLNVAFTGGAAIGPAIAGLVIAGFGIQTALLLDAVSFYLIALFLLTAGPLPRVIPEPGAVRDRVRAGLSYVRRQPTLRRLLVAQGAAFLFFAAVIPIEVIYAKQILGTGASGYGLLLASWGIGMVVGSVVFAAARSAPLQMLLLISTIGIGIGYLGLAAAPTLAAACGASIVGGAGNGVQWVAVISAVQELTMQTMQARVISVLESIGAALPGFGYVLGGLIATAGSPRTTFLVAGIGVLVIVAVATPILGGQWPQRVTDSNASSLDLDSEIVLELLAGGKSIQRDPEVKA